MRKKLLGVVLPLLAFLLFSPTSAWSAKIVQNDYKIDSIDPGIKLFVRECWQIFTPLSKVFTCIRVHGGSNR